MGWSYLARAWRMSPEGQASEDLNSTLETLTAPDDFSTIGTSVYGVAHFKLSCRIKKGWPHRQIGRPAEVGTY